MYSYLYNFVKDKEYLGRELFLAWAAWVCIWTAILLFLLAIFNACTVITRFTRIAGELFGMLINVLFLQEAIKVQGAVFDLPEEIAKELLTKQTPPGNTISKITKLPALQDDGPSNDNYGRFSNRDRGFWGGSRERGGFRGSRGRGGGGGRDFNDGYHGGRSSRSDNSWSQSSSWSLVNVLLN